MGIVSKYHEWRLDSVRKEAKDPKDPMEFLQNAMEKRSSHLEYFLKESINKENKGKLDKTQLQTEVKKRLDNMKSDLRTVTDLKVISDKGEVVTFNDAFSKNKDQKTREIVNLFNKQLQTAKTHQQDILDGKLLWNSKTLENFKGYMNEIKSEKDLETKITALDGAKYIDLWRAHQQLKGEFKPTTPKLESNSTKIGELEFIKNGDKWELTSTKKVTPLPQAPKPIVKTSGEVFGPFFDKVVDIISEKHAVWANVPEYLKKAFDAVYNAPLNDPKFATKLKGLNTALESAEIKGKTGAAKDKVLTIESAFLTGVAKKLETEPNVLANEPIENLFLSKEWMDTTAWQAVEKSRNKLVPKP